MKTENQVCSFEQSKKLKKLGLSVISEYCFTVTMSHEEDVAIIPYFEKQSPDADWYPAFTAIELWAMLPAYIEDEMRVYVLKSGKIEGRSWVGYMPDESKAYLYSIREKLCDAMADMLIWVIENKYLKIKDLLEK